ncbi:hypothetical protein BCR35DRAFT_324226 [Leucosporidium creatinivorum]|uniref:FAD-binding domain-containing protein n=1 Tax=Leucosporidium creatinivorum TaxID=106004 RepID=A0A1Y2FX96_9BASI|nr:hypothetical protein BCR35DRAFT_324226 [Leucosporidium creatinivorum]
MGFFSGAKVHSTTTSRVVHSHRSPSAEGGGGLLTPSRSPSSSNSTSPTSSATLGGRCSPRLIKLPVDPLTPPPDRTFHLPTSSSDSYFTSDSTTFAFSHLRTSDHLRAVVIGTGFAGLSAAIALSRQSYSVTLLERSTGLSKHGDSITFGSNAARILDRWGVGREMWERSSGSAGWEILDQMGGRVWREDVAGFRAIYGAPLLQGSRPQFLGSLGVEARMLGVDIRYESEVVGYWDAEEEPAVVLRGGEVVKSDVIIIADGVHSTARELLAAHRGPPTPTQKSGYSIYRGAMKSNSVKADPVCAHLLDGNIRTWLGDDVHAAIYPLDRGRQIAFTITHRDPHSTSSLNYRDRKPIRDVLHIIKNWDPALVKAVGMFGTALHWDIMDETPAAEWISEGGKIVCVGDAVHALQPTSFQGGSQAIEDGATLAICLALAGGAPSSVGLALEVYEMMRRPRVVEAQKLGHEQQLLWHSYTRSPTSPSSLRPLAFSLYSHDAEAYALLHFERLAREVDPGFRVGRGVMEGVLRNVGLEREEPSPKPGVSTDGKQEEWVRTHAHFWTTT